MLKRQTWIMRQMRHIPLFTLRSSLLLPSPPVESGVSSCSLPAS
jgi:hypothetical protein